MTSTVALSGAASPFFAAISERLTSDGFAVVDISNEESNPRQEQGCSPADIRSHSGSYSSAGPLAGLVLCETYFSYEPQDGFNRSTWVAHIDEILLRRLHVIETLAPLLVSGAGVVLITTAETERGAYGALPYVASQAAVHGAVRGLANRLGRESGVRVNAVAPGWIRDVLDDEAAKRVAIEHTPLARLGSISEVAAAVAFLVRSDASFISGQVLIVDGGYLCSDPVASAEYNAVRQNATQR